MSIKALALVLIALVLVMGLIKFMSDQKEKRSGSSNYIQQSVNAVKSVESMQEERAKTILQQERELEGWE